VRERKKEVGGGVREGGREGDQRGVEGEEVDSRPTRERERERERERVGWGWGTGVGRGVPGLHSPRHTWLQQGEHWTSRRLPFRHSERWLRVGSV
jgi:hypothetical protein